MEVPFTGELARWLAVPFGVIFGFLLHRGGVADYGVIVNQFRLRDFTVLKVMFTAIVVGGIGVALLHQVGWAQYHVKPANLLAVVLGAGLFGIGMVLYGYCPGTGVAAMATGSIHALVGFVGMLAGAVSYAFGYSWIAAHVLPVSDLGKLRLPDVTGIRSWIWYALLAGTALLLWRLLENPKPSTAEKSSRPPPP